jgi:hypothetical protein
MERRTIGQKALAIAVFLLLLTGKLQAGERFVDNGDGTVMDRKTGLMWAKDDNNGDITWQDASLYAKNITLSTYSDWRLPTIAELQTLFDKSLPGYETICGHHVRIDPVIQVTCGFLWSAETRSISALAFNLSRGYRYMNRKVRSRGMRALPVRTAK